MSDAAQDFLATLTASSSGDAADALAQASAKTALDTLTSILNTSLNGEHLFAGVNTDVKPLNDFSDPGSPVQGRLRRGFLAHFGFAQADPAAANIIGRRRWTTFIDNALEPQFLGAGWQANWSNATDQKIVSRIALNETAETSVSANADGIRKLAMAAASISDLFDSNLSVAGQEAADRACLRDGRRGNRGPRRHAGADRHRREARHRRQRPHRHAGRSVREATSASWKASTRTRRRRGYPTCFRSIETSYALTARIQQLSLLQFLG